jgi:predicted Zn-dependent protease/uncharacterized integral membrane protein
MKRAVAVIVGVAMVCLVAYLSWLNPAAVEFRLTPARSIQAPLAVLMVLAFVVGISLVFTAVLVQAGRRAIVAWQLGRQQRRIERIDDWEARGEELIWKGEAQQGRALLQRASQRRPDGAHAVLALAESFCETGEFQRACEVLAAAANRDEASPDVLLALAKAQCSAGDRAAGIAVLERLRALRPQAPRVLRALREAYVEAERWADATALQEALVGQVRDPAQAGRERAGLVALRYQMAVHLGDVSSRVQALEALADSRAGSVPVWVSLGDALLASGRQDEASLVWERALRTQPRTVFVERLASIASEERHRERLRLLMRKLRADQVRADMVRLLTAQLYLKDGNAAQAARELEGLQNPGAAPALVHRLWAEVHSRRGQLEQAVVAYAQADAGLATYHCNVCGRIISEWKGYCPQCREWDSYRSEAEIGVA